MRDKVCTHFDQWTSFSLSLTHSHTDTHARTHAHTQHINRRSLKRDLWEKERSVDTNLNTQDTNLSDLFYLHTRVHKRGLNHHSFWNKCTRTSSFYDVALTTKHPSNGVLPWSQQILSRQEMDQRPSKSSLAVVVQ